MECVLNNSFVELSAVDSSDVNGGGWYEFGMAFGGTMCIAAAPIILATGNAPGALVAAGAGLDMIGNQVIAKLADARLQS